MDVLIEQFAVFAPGLLVAALFVLWRRAIARARPADPPAVAVHVYLMNPNPTYRVDEHYVASSRPGDRPFRRRRDDWPGGAY